MVKDHSDSEKGNPLLPHRLLFPTRFFYMHHPTDRIAHTIAYYTSRGALAGMKNSSMTDSLFHEKTLPYSHCRLRLKMYI